MIFFAQVFQLCIIAVGRADRTYSMLLTVSPEPLWHTEHFLLGVLV